MLDGWPLVWLDIMDSTEEVAILWEDSISHFFPEKAIPQASATARSSQAKKGPRFLATTIRTPDRELVVCATAAGE
jgi:hypothetical protein